jgi:peptide-methionine (S)-S-oxide reductase
MTAKPCFQSNLDMDVAPPLAMERMIVGGGCFWCVEGAYKQIHGVESALPAYAGGHVVNPSYEAVCTGATGHAEVVEVQFDPSVISLETLLEVFFTVHDPTQLNRQGNDIGTQYRSCIMPLTEDQRLVAQNTIASMSGVYDEPIVTTLEEPTNFVIAEEKHHDYYARNPYQGYCAAVVGPKIAKVRAKHAHLYR